MNARKTIERILFSTKWMLIPFYMGLMVALSIFLWIDLKEVYHMVSESNGLDKTSSMMFILELVDMAMIAALVRMIIIGGYTSFVNKNHSEEGEKSSSGVLKVKLGTALIGVSSINLLQSFISLVNNTSHNGPTMTWETLLKQLSIHGAFLLGAIVLSYIDYLHVKSEEIHHSDWDKSTKS